MIPIHVHIVLGSVESTDQQRNAKLCDHVRAINRMTWAPVCQTTSWKNQRWERLAKDLKIEVHKQIERVLINP